MKIAIFSLAPLHQKNIMGGSQKILHELATSLGEYGHEIKVWCSSSEHNQEKFVLGSSNVYPYLFFRGKFPSPYQVPPINLVKSLKLIRKASEWADRIYLHADGMYHRDSFIGKKIIRSFHDFIYDEAIISSLAFNAEATIVPSDYLKQCIEATLVLSDKKKIEPIITVPNGIKINKNLNLVSNKANDSGEVNLLFPHRPQITKGIIQAVKIAVKLQDKIPKKKVNLLAPYFSSNTNNDDTSLSYEKIFKIAKNEEAKNILKLYQWLPHQNMDDLYSSASITLCPGNFVESFGLVPLESVINHTPVVCSSVGGFRSYSNIPAIKLFPYGDIDNAVELICDSLETSMDIFFQSKEIISNEYSYTNMISQYEKIITDNNVIHQKIHMKNKNNHKLAPWCSIEKDYIYNDYSSERLYVKNLNSLIKNNNIINIMDNKLNPSDIKKAIDLGYIIQDYQIQQL